MNNTLLYVWKWIYSQSYCHWYVRRLKYVWHKETVKLTDVGWFCWCQSWRGNLSTANWQITEIKEPSITYLSRFPQIKHSFTGLPAAVFIRYAWKRERQNNLKTLECSCAGEPTEMLTHRRAVNADVAVSTRSTCRKGKGGLVPLLGLTPGQMRASQEKLQPSL